MRKSAAASAGSGRHDRRKAVELALGPFARRPAFRRVVPPEGRIGPGDFPVRELRETLAALGPVFAAFGRYLATRPDLLPRRHCAELALIPDVGEPADPRALDALVARQLGAVPSRVFLQFDPAASDVTLWTERHDAWIAPGVPAVVTIVRPDAAGWLDADLPLLGLAADTLGVDRDASPSAIEDFSHTLRLRLDQTVQAAALATLAADAPTVGGFHAPTCYRDHCAPALLAAERCDGPTLDQLMSRRHGLTTDERAQLARRLSSCWLRQALGGRFVPFGFAARDIVVEDERLVLTGGACEPHGTAERARFLRYLNAVAADDPDAAASWIVDAPSAHLPSAAMEEELKRRFRQAVPFRDGEWSGNDQLAESVLVQWRVGLEAGWALSPHHLHVYNGIAVIAGMAETLAPGEDPLQEALQDARLRAGVSEAGQLLDPSALASRMDNLMREMVNLPQKIDEVLTLAAEGRLRFKLQVPDGGERRRVKQQTIMLVASLVLVTAIASLVRHIAPMYGPAVERVAVLVLLIVGGWLLVAAAKF